MKLSRHTYYRVIHFVLIMSIGLNVYLYNNNETLEKLVLINPTSGINTKEELKQAIKDEQVYKATGQLPDLNATKPLDKLLNKF